MPATIRASIRTYGIDLLVALAVALAAAWFLTRPIEARHTVLIGANDRALINGFHEAEISTAEGRTFRWTTGASSLLLPALGFGDHTLALRLATTTAENAVTQTSVALNGAELATLPLQPAPRTYHLLAPGALIRPADNTITLSSATFRLPGDRRDLGIVAFAASLAATQPQDWLAPAQTAAIALATLLLLLALQRIDAGRMRWLAALLFAAISLSMRHSDLRFDQRWEALLLSIGLAGVFALGLALIRSTAHAAHQLHTRKIEDHKVAGGAQPSTFNLQPSSLIIYTLLTILLLAPLIPNPAGAIPGPLGDNLEYVWKIQWFADALAARRSPTFVPYLFSPTGYELAYSELTPAHTLLGLPLTLLGGAVIAYNLLIAASFILTALFAMLLAERLGAGRFGAFIAGVGVGFCLWRYQHILGQMNMIGTQWVVLAVYGLEGWLQRRRASDALVTGLGVALAAWSSWYYGPTLWLLLALWLLLRWPWKETRALLAAWPAALAAPLAALALLAPYAHPTVQALRGGEARHDYEMLVQLAARPLDYLAPSRYHAIWGEWAAQVAPDTAGAQLVAPGFSLLALALVGLWRWRKQRVAWALFAAGAACVIMSLGPEARLGNLVIPLPAYLAYEYVPVLGSIRAWSRVAFYAQICIGMLAALGLVGFGQWRPYWKMAGVALALGVLIESANLAPWSAQTAPRPVDAWLAQQPGASATLQVPDSFAGPIEYYALFSQRPSLTGYGTFVPEGAITDMSWLREFPAERSITTLRRLGGEYVLVRRELMDRERPGWREQASRRAELTQVYEDDAFTVFRVER